MQEVRSKALFATQSLGLKSDEELVSMKKAIIADSPLEAEIPTRQSSLSFNSASADRLEEAIGEFIFYGGLPFNLVKSPYFKSLLEAAKSTRTPIIVPNINKLRTGLLENKKAATKERVTEILKKSNVTKLTVASDGWENISKKPIINCMIVCPAGEIFFDSIHTGFETKTGQHHLATVCIQLHIFYHMLCISGDYISDYIGNCIIEIGKENVIEFITDGASNCKRAGKLIEEKFPTIFHRH